MKLILFSVFLSGLIFGFSIKLNAQNPQIKVYNQINSEVMLAEPDQGFIMFGNNSQKAIIARFDSIGNNIWDRTYQFKDSIPFYNSRFTYAIKCSDSGYAATGSIFKTSYNYGTGFVVKTNSAGDTLWTKKIVHPGFNFSDPHCITQCLDSGLVICGTNGSGGSLFIAKLQSNGQIVFFKLLAGNFTSQGYTIKQTPDSGFIIAGSRNGCAALIKLNSLANVVWSKSYCYGVSSQSSKAQDLLVVSDGYLFCNDLYPITLIKTDFNGNVQWNKSYITGYSSWYNPFRDLRLKPISGQRFLISHGSVQNISGSFSIVCDSLGIPSWMNTTLRNADVIQQKNKRFVFTAGPPAIVFKSPSFFSLGTAIIITDSLATSSSTCLAKTIVTTTISTVTTASFAAVFANTGGLIAIQPTLGVGNYSFTPGCFELGTSNEELKQSGVSIYPNPSNGNIYIQAQDAIGKNIVITIYNSQGQKIKQVSTQIEKSETFINTSELPASLYIYTISLEGKKLKTGKLIVEK